MGKLDPILDTSDPATFDLELISILQGNHNLIQSYLKREQEIFEIYDNYYGPRRPKTRPNNVHWNQFHALLDEVTRLVEIRTIRGFHYTRMTDSEVKALLTSGIRLSTPKFLKQRLDSLIKEGHITHNESETILRESPFRTQLDIRQNMFWMVSSFLPADDNGVEPLLATWGGEVASMHLTDQRLLKKLREIGRPRIIEVAVPVSSTNKAYSAGKSVVSSYALLNGWPSEDPVFDFYSMNDLPENSILQLSTID